MTTLHGRYRYRSPTRSVFGRRIDVRGRRHDPVVGGQRGCPLPPIGGEDVVAFTTAGKTQLTNLERPQISITFDRGGSG